MIKITKSLLWATVTILIIISGLYYTKKLSYPQFKIKKLKQSLKQNKNQEVTPIKALFLALAGRIGVGSISGIALAIYIGGPGTILWMWVIAIIASPLAYAETILSIKTKQKNVGGPSYYIKKYLKKPKLATAYSILILIAYIIGFIPIQANTIVISLPSQNQLTIGIIISTITYIIIKGGIKKITKITNKLVPIMTIIYISMAFFVLLTQTEKIPVITKEIIKQAFQIKPFFTGFIATILIGIQRAIFSNESGLGLGGIAASASENTNPKQSGYIQILGVYITTLIICTSTAIIILTFNYQNINIPNPNGIEIANKAFQYHFGNIGNNLLVISIILFSFTTILTGHYYCETSLKYIKQPTKYLTIITPLSIIIGAITSPTTIWQTIDIIVALLAIINIYALIKLKKQIIEIHTQK